MINKDENRNGSANAGPSLSSNPQSGRYGDNSPLLDEQKISKWGQLKWLWLTVFVVVIDLVAKAWVSNTFRYGEMLEVLPIFDLTLLHNKGAAFSFLANEGGWQRWFFAVIAVVVSGVLLVWLKRLKPNETWLAIALAMVLGGALGNLHDRVLLGYVVDFLFFHWENNYFPAFNLADTAISLGAGMLIVDMIRNPENKKS